MAISKEPVLVDLTNPLTGTERVFSMPAEEADALKVRKISLEQVDEEGSGFVDLTHQIGEIHIQVIE